MNTRGKHGRWFGVITIAIVCLALGQAGDLRGEEEKDPAAAKLAKELAAKLDQLDAATARFEKAEDEADINAAARQAQALVDWLVTQAKKIEKHFSARDEKEIALAAADLGRAAGESKGLWGDWFLGKTSRPKIVAAVKKVRKSGDKVLSLIGTQFMESMRQQ